ALRAERSPGHPVAAGLAGGEGAAGEDDLQPRQVVPQPAVEQRHPAAGVVDAGRRHHDRQQEPQAIDPGVPLAAGDLLAGVVAALAALRGRLDRLAVGGRGPRAGVAPGAGADPLAQGLVDAVPGAVVAPASVPGVDRGPGREVVRQQAPLAAGADQVEDGVEHLAQFGRRPAGALGPGEERLDEGELVIGQVSVITLGSHNPFYGSEPGFRTGSEVRLIDRQLPLPRAPAEVLITFEVPLLPRPYPWVR